MSFFAYIDPGMGLLLWQSLIAACLGMLFYLKKTRTWIVKVFRKLFRIDKRPEEIAEKVEPMPK